MFTGIIENLATLISIEEKGTNVDFTLSSSITSELQVDQSIAHNGVCLTVVSIDKDHYVVSAIDETLKKSNLGGLAVGDPVNLERSVTLDRRMDGHMVQGHVDTTAICKSIDEQKGSWIFRFQVDPSYDKLMVEKGSICVNGTSLTIFDIEGGQFSVAIIPYTYENTIFHKIKIGDSANIEFDMMGKYIVKYMERLTAK